MVRPNPTRVLVWMCVLIAVNQLGFGSVVPVLALYARSFGVTQSAISQQIAKLEAEAGQPLLERYARGVRLTEAGAGTEQLQPLPVESEVALAPASSSAAPSNFTNASPFQSKKEKKDPKKAENP